MSLFAGSCLVTFILAFGLSFLIYFRQKKSLQSILWVAISIAVGLWSLGLFGVVTSTDKNIAYLWQYLLDVCGIFVPVIFFHFAIVFLGKITDSRQMKRISLLYLIGLALALFSFSSYFKQDLAPTLGFNFWIVPGEYYFIFPLFFAIVSSFSFIVLINGYFTESGEKKTQIKYIIFAISLGFGGGATNFFPQLLNIYPLGNYFVAFYVIFVAYTITQHHFLNLRVFSTELLVWIIAAALLLEVIVARDINEFVVKLVLFILFCYLGISLINNIFSETQRREETEKLAIKLKNANDELQKLDKSKSEFLSMASHQLRTPLSAIKGYISMVLEGSYGKLNAKQKDKLGNVFLSNERLIKIVDDLLNISKIEIGKMELNKAVVSIPKLLSECYEEMKTISKKKDLELVWEAPKTNIPDISIDENKIRQVITNLLDNAIKYTDEGKIILSLDKRGSYLYISVKDTGDGLRADEIGKLFQGFSRGTAGINMFIEGTGLGLYVARKYLELHKGRIWAESEGKGRGSTFVIELPIT